MPIYRKLIKRESKVIVAVEADDIKESNKIFEEWYNNDDNIESTSELLAEREKDSEVWLTSFPNWEELNRSGVDCADFIIKKPDDEPKYDLYFFIDEKRKYCYPGITMKTVAQELDYYNNPYKLIKSSIWKHFNDVTPSDNYIIVFDAVKRSEDRDNG